jgi:SOS-response transcriptional repressor LexA
VSFPTQRAEAGGISPALRHQTGTEFNTTPRPPAGLKMRLKAMETRMPATNGRKKRLTPKQFAVFKFIRDQISTSGVPPSRKEIADHFGFSSPNAAESHLRALERKGLISTVPHQARGIRLEVASAPKSSLPKAEKKLGPKTVSLELQDNRLHVGSSDVQEVFEVTDSELESDGISKGDLAVIRAISEPGPSEGYLLIRENGQKRLMRSIEYLEKKEKAEAVPELVGRAVTLYHRLCIAPDLAPADGTQKS